MMTLDRFMGEELRSRYLNPKWIEAMFKEGYAAGRFVQQVTDNLWGWQVTVPEAVDAAKWQEMYEVYVKDRYDLGIREKLADAGNLAALQAIVNRMLTAVDKNYWQPPAEALADLRSVQAELVPGVKAETAAVMQKAAELDAMRERLSDAAPSQLAPSAAVLPGAVRSSSPARRSSASQPLGHSAAPAASQAPAGTVQGRVIEDVARSGAANPQDVVRWSLAMMLGVIGRSFRPVRRRLVAAGASPMRLTPLGNSLVARSGEDS
jgi:cobaltochelatase CobN